MHEAARRRVLIVDDERDLVAPLLLRLGATGRFELAAAYDGEEGLFRALQFRPEIALIDLAMPVADGWSLCRGLRADERTRGARLVIMTAWLTPDLGKRAAAEGVERLLLKPFEDAELMKALDDERAPAGGAPGGGGP